MKIAILSGKGGTGKTLLSVNMAAVAKKSTYIDCDVEEPNGHLFFKPQNVTSKEVAVQMPVVDQALCNGCKTCVEFCKFNALAYTKGGLMIFEDICHSCRGCVLFCPQKALSEKDLAIGTIEEGISDNVTICTGILNTGVPSGVPIIEELLDKQTPEDEFVMIDCPPGSACIVMESIQDADYCILVAEPTLFGVHNLEMVYQLVKLFKKPHGVVLNKCLPEANPAEAFCIENEIPIIGKIPYDQELGTINSNALIAARETDKYKDLFTHLLNKVVEEVQHETITNP